MTEFSLIDRMRERMRPRGDRVVVWSGDDAAVVRPAGGVSVTSIDSFVEGVHFRLATTSLRDLGHKCLAASLSDLAAMGADPGEAYIALGLPDHIGEREVLELAEGAEPLAAEHGVTICGGDISRADELFVSVTVVGYAGSAADLVCRDGARAGDLVGVTGALGGSGAGLLLLERKPAGGDREAGERLLERHRRPRPLLATGRALARAGVSAMLDVSDGVASDAERICERSDVAAEIRLARPAARGGCRRGRRGARARPARVRGRPRARTTSSCSPPRPTRARRSSSAAARSRDRGDLDRPDRARRQGERARQAA